MAQTPAKKAEDTVTTQAKKVDTASNLDWLEMATGGKQQEKPVDKPVEKPAAVKQLETKPATTATKSNKAADWLGLKDDDEEEFDFLKSSSFSAPARQGPPTVSDFCNEQLFL